MAGLLLLLCSRRPVTSGADVVFTDAHSGVTQKMLCDLGMVLPQSVHSRRFVIRNDSTQELKIQGFNISCSCMKPELTWKTLRPGEDGSLQVSFKAGTENKQQQGFLEARFESNTALRVVFNAAVRATFVPKVARMYFRTSPKVLTVNEDLLIDAFHTDSPPAVRVIEG
jgi:hypothetical protein